VLIAAGRAAGITAGSMVAGIMLGAVLNVWLQIDIVPIGVSGLAWLGLGWGLAGVGGLQLSLRLGFGDGSRYGAWEVWLGVGWSCL